MMSMKLWERRPPGILRVCPGLYWDSFTVFKFEENTWRSAGTAPLLLNLGIRRRCGKLQAPSSLPI